MTTPTHLRAMVLRLACAGCIAGALLGPSEGFRITCLALMALGVGLQAGRAR